ncbi:SMI1/KNR4 family protein [Achromobacter spanius]|jgi:hypothetical protein|uniref:SMI1/KNR4 family protein n=1 Tax=Achromobacter spanius TaxID=217203 RepID=A0AA42LSY7_9BURK|nr:SMI1/KNR4 family protein [Achromobacter spanius]MDH0738946.1 SMI1/KNR4 family protein [Achromobacter spanius]
MNTVPQWLSAAGAPPELLHRLQREVEGLPESYLDLLRIGNGGEVGLSVRPYNLCLDAAEDALDYWLSGAYTKQNVFVIGSNGGGELIAFDLGNAGKSRVICYDPISPDDSAEVIAESFEKLLEFCEVV